MKKRKPSKNRSLVALAFLVVIAIGFFTLVGIGNMSAIGWDIYSLICPLGYLESLLAGKLFIPRALLSFIIVVALIVVLGRVFCAWVCPMPQLQRWIPGMDARKAKKARAEKGAAEDATTVPAAKSAATPTPAEVVQETQEAQREPNRFKFDSRYGVLIGALASAAIFGFPVFCLICPVGLTFLSVLLIMRLFAFGEVTWTVIVVPLVLAFEVIFARSWCHRFCPLGALISLISGANKTLRPTIDDSKCLRTSKGVNCTVCSKVCPEKIDIRRPAISETSLNNCTKCTECSAACPGHAITFPFLPKKGADAAGAGMQGSDTGSGIVGGKADEGAAVSTSAKATVAQETEASPIGAPLTDGR